MFSPPEELDYAVVALGERRSGSATPQDLGFAPLLNWPDKHAIGMPVNIIQHPNRWPKMIAIRNNYLTHRTDTTLLYETDTEEGSSGSPVFNDDWELVALHHWGAPHNQLRDENGAALPGNVNEGIRISAIYEDLAGKAKEAAGSATAHALLVEALGYANLPQADRSEAVTPAAPNGLQGQSSVLSSNGMQPPAQPSSNGGSISVTVPLEISVRIADGSVQGVSPVTVNSVAVPAGAEAVQLDTNYANRPGYNPKFIRDHELALPKLSAQLKQHVARLVAGPNPASGELKYEHFSVKVNKTTRIAVFTATNVDGATYLEVDRATGLVAADEGDRWFLDPRIDQKDVLGQAFYTDWSTQFDRGHLTRRSDPTWGSPALAERANADTFHFTNCSPQHWLFNESAKYWQGLERYVLENGVLDTDPHKRISVFQGPIFDHAVDRTFGDTLVPMQYWKIVVWPGRNGLKAVGLTADQSGIIDIPRHSIGQPHALDSVDVQHNRVPISEIEKETGLTFPKELVDADTIQQPGQPRVGAEGIRPITTWTDIDLGD